MTDQHPITPPRELVNEWLHKPEFAQPGLFNLVTITTNKLNQICADATQWGADQRGKVNEAKLQEARDQELEACCEWLGTQLLDDYDLEPIADDLRAARRAARHHHHTGE